MRVAVIQCRSGADLATNQAQLAELTAQAAEDGAQWVLLPEMCLCMDATQYVSIADDASILSWFSALAQRHGIWLLAGAIPQPEPQPVPNDEKNDQQRVRSALLVFNPHGELCERYDKVHLFDVDVTDTQGSYRESDRFSAGNEIKTVTTGELSVGLSICFDLRFPSHYQQLRRAGAQLLVVPAAFTHTTGQAHWEVLLRARAIEQQCYVVAANQCGWHDERRQTWGHSMIIDPWGKVLAELNESIGFICADIDLARMVDIRKRMPLRP
ncbi:MAG: carbon-nitrogen hydrolase family protein [Oleibacter sp.]|nr:carbon-nitrogen hydrolase family protein [Thalassolituus sp.]